MASYAALSIDHLDGVAALERACFSEAEQWKGTYLACLCEEGTGFVCLIEGTVVGVILWQLYSGSEQVPHPTVISLCVGRAYRRLGIGSTLLQMALSSIQADWDLQVRVSNEGAQTMYLKAGFVPIETIIDYYHDPTEDAIYMRRSLPPAAGV
jgi:ribosomal-protein-alanine N-acetyltransferase